MNVNDNQRRFQQKVGQYSSMKAIQILSAISEQHNQYISIAELSQITGLSASTVHRVLQELLACGFVEKDEKQHVYRAGVEAWVFAMHLKGPDYLRIAAQSEMERLNELSLETIHLIALEGDRGIYLSKISCQHTIGLHSQIGKHLPLYCTGGGKALMAWQSQQWLQNYMHRVHRERFTGHTLVTEEELTREMELIRQRGYSLDDHEHHEDVVCIGAPVFGASGEVVCSISISAPDYRFSLEHAMGFAEELKKSASIIHERLSGGSQ